MTSRPSTAEPCVDCSTPVIGGGGRCPACRWKHAASGHAKPLSATQAAVVWLAVSLNVVIVAVILIFAGRNCQ